jgi:hypothetical protein
MVPMLQAMPGLRVTTLLEELQRHHPGRYPDRLLRSLHIATRNDARPDAHSSAISDAR